MQEQITPLTNDTLQLILLEGPLDWLFVNKHFSSLAFTHLLTDPRVDPSTNDNYAIKHAAAEGHYSVVKLLSSDPRVNCSEALYYACEKGYVEIAKLLLPMSHLDEEEMTGIVENAAQDNMADVITLLMADKHWDPEIYGRTAMEVAVCNNAYDVVKALLEDSNIDTYEALNEAFDNHDTKLIELLLSAPQCRLSDSIWLSAAESADITKLLLQNPRINPVVIGTANPLASAATKGDVELVELIIANNHFDPKKEKCQQMVNEAITAAEVNQHRDIAQLLRAATTSAGSSIVTKENKCIVC